MYFHEKSTSKRAAQNAKALRKNLTPAERNLWQRLRLRQMLNLHVRRQCPIGNYIADFLIPACNIVIELDGESHNFTVEQDKERDQFFHNEGYIVLRFKNEKIHERLDDVLETIRLACDKRI